jgi:hypothetical protein
MDYQTFQSVKNRQTLSRALAWVTHYRVPVCVTTDHSAGTGG